MPIRRSEPRYVSGQMFRKWIRYLPDAIAAQGNVHYLFRNAEWHGRSSTFVLAAMPCGNFRRRNSPPRP